MSQDGFVVRSRIQEAALRRRLLTGRWIADLYEAMQDHLGQVRTAATGPLDTSRNALLRIVNRLAVSYTPPPLVSGLEAALAELIGDYVGPEAVADYGRLGGRPMPSVMAAVMARAQRFWVGCNECAVVPTWGDEAPILRVATVDDLDGIAAPENPDQPVVLRWKRARKVGMTERVCTDEWDLRQRENPIYRIVLGGAVNADGLLEGGEDVTQQVTQHTYSGDLYPWRWSDGTPYMGPVVYHRDPGATALWDEYAGSELSNGTLLVAVYWTYWGHVLKDCGFPRLWMRGCHIPVAAPGTGSAQGAQGAVSDPAAITTIEDDMPGVAGQVGHFPQADPEVVGRSILQYEQQLEYHLVPVDYSSTGGDPLAQLAAAREAVIRGYSTICRQYDGMVLARLAALCNRYAQTAFPEEGYGLHYRDEIDALRRAKRESPGTAPPDSDAAGDTDTDTEE